jgi:hypothetical protein
MTIEARFPRAEGEVTLMRSQSTIVRAAGAALLTLGALIAAAPGCAMPVEILDDPIDEESTGDASSALVFGNVGSIMQVVNSNLCMTATTLPDGTLGVTQQSCISDRSRWFYARPIAGSTVNFTIEAVGRCLTVPGSSTAAGVDLVLSPCTGGNNQQFRFNPSADGFEIRPRFWSTLCLDVEWFNSTPGMALQQAHCNNQGNQRFRIRPTMSEERFDCDQSDSLYLRWPSPSYENYSSIWLLDGQVVHFGAAHVRWCEGACGSGTGWWDDEKYCPAGTTTIEISRLEADRDEFRLRCIM